MCSWLCHWNPKKTTKDLEKLNFYILKPIHLTIKQTCLSSTRRSTPESSQFPGESIKKNKNQKSDTFNEEEIDHEVN